MHQAQCGEANALRPVIEQEERDDRHGPRQDQQEDSPGPFVHEGCSLAAFHEGQIAYGEGQ